MSDVLILAVVIEAALGVLLWMIPSPCRCAQCGFHVNERRMAALRQAELNHDTEHKGFGWKTGAPDRFACHDESCPRNPKVPVDF